MKIAVYKNDTDRFPYLVHWETSNIVILGLKDYPDVEQDFETDIKEVEILHKNSKEYLEAKKIIGSL